MASNKKKKLEDYYKIDIITGCWNAVFGRRDNDYAYIRINYKFVVLHRFIYEKIIGPIPQFLILDHLCRNKYCCNPEHLEPVTEAENRRRGNSAKLTRKQVDEIRFLAPTNTYTALAKQFGVSIKQISNIVNFKKWVGQERPPVTVARHT